MSPSAAGSGGNRKHVLAIVCLALLCLAEGVALLVQHGAARPPGESAAGSSAITTAARMNKDKLLLAALRPGYGAVDLRAVREELERRQEALAARAGTGEQTVAVLDGVLNEYLSELISVRVAYDTGAIGQDYYAAVVSDSRRRYRIAAAILIGPELAEQLEAELYRHFDGTLTRMQAAASGAGGSN